MPVEVVFTKLTDDVTVPLFQPARATDRTTAGGTPPAGGIR
jgi:hypothetical protein